MAQSKTTTTVIFLGLGVLAFVLYRKFRALTNLQFIARGVELAGGGIVIQLGVQNPTSAPLLLKSIVGKLVVNGSPIGNISDFVQQQIDPLAETTIPITITPDLFGQFGALINQLTSGATGFQSVEMTGTANVGDTLIPIDLNFI